MNHLFEYLRKHNGQTGDSSSDSIEAAWANITHSPDQEESGDLERIPVEEVLVEAASRIVFHGDPSSPGADRFRLLRMRLRDVQNQTRLRSLLVTSPLPHDGKSTIALNLATALAERGKSRVLLIEADLHHACLTLRLGIKPWTGLAECLEGDLNPLSAIRRLEPLGWYI